MASWIEVRESGVVEAIWSRWVNKFVYEGCPLLLKDGEVCASSFSRRRRRTRSQRVIDATAVTMCAVRKGGVFRCIGSR